MTLHEAAQHYHLGTSAMVDNIITLGGLKQPRHVPTMNALDFVHQALRARRVADLKFIRMLWTTGSSGCTELVGDPTCYDGNGTMSPLMPNRTISRRHGPR